MVSGLTLRFRLFVLIIFVCIPTLLAGGRDAALDNVRTTLRAEYLTEPHDENAARSFLESQTSEGTWTDIDFSDRSGAGWFAFDHLTRVRLLARSFADTGDTTMLDATLLGLRYWFEKGYTNPNWYYSKIAIPRMMLAIAYILDDNLSGSLRSRVKAEIDIIDSNDYPARPGGDRIQVISNDAAAAIWERDYETAAKLFGLMCQEARFAPVEEIMYDAAGGLSRRNNHRPAGRGVQSDFSFHHRGDRVDNSLCYGIELPVYFTKWARLLAPTDYAFDSRSIRFVIDYFLDGICLHTIDDYHSEPGAWNRELARKKKEMLSPEMAIGLLEVCDGYRQDELQAVADVQAGRTKFDKTDSKFFHQSEYFIRRSPRYVASVRMHSVRNANMEYPHNGEGVRNHFRGDGACHLSLAGDEYETLAPVCNFNLIPGVTSVIVPEFPDETQCQKPGLSTFVGGIADGVNGLATFGFISPHYELNALKSWFFFDDGYVCLGSAISSTEDMPVVTTVEQCLGRERVIIGYDDGSCEGLDKADIPMADISYAIHNGVRYQMLDDSPVTLTLDSVTGSWSNCLKGVNFENERASEKIFTLTLSHGIRPQAASYAYCIIPDGEGRNPSDIWRIISNNDTIQAVTNANESVTGIVFHKPASVTVAGGSMEITVDRPCAILLSHGKIHLTDPSRKEYEINFSINGEKRHIALPTWNLAGSTITLSPQTHND